MDSEELGAEGYQREGQDIKILIIDLYSILIAFPIENTAVRHQDMVEGMIPRGSLMP